MAQLFAKSCEILNCELKQESPLRSRGFRLFLVAVTALATIVAVALAAAALLATAAAARVGIVVVGSLVNIYNLALEVQGLVCHGVVEVHLNGLVRNLYNNADYGLAHLSNGLPFGSRRLKNNRQVFLGGFNFNIRWCSCQSNLESK